MTQRETEIALEIRRLAREELGLAWDGADGEDLAGRLDSLALLSLVVAVEDRFRIRITDDDAAVTRSLADLAALVAGRTSSPPAEGAEAAP